jgi:AhpD family alkylhydroperoxidase
MSTTPRVSSAIDGEEASLRNALAHQPRLAAAFSHMYGTMWNDGVLGQALKETIRMRNARVTDCGFCKFVRFDGAQRAGLTEDQVEQIVDGHERSTLSTRQKLALRFTDGYLHDPARVPDELMDELRGEFSDAEIVEMGLALTMYMSMAKVLISLGTEPEQMDVTVLPTPQPRVAAVR